MHDREGYQAPYHQITEKLGPSPGEFGDQAGSPPHVFQLIHIQHFPIAPITPLTPVRQPTKSNKKSSEVIYGNMMKPVPRVWDQRVKRMSGVKLDISQCGECTHCSSDIIKCKRRSR